MTNDDPLKQIERQVEEHLELWNKREDDDSGVPRLSSDVVKLARALDACEKGLLTRNEAKQVLEDVASDKR